MSKTKEKKPEYEVGIATQQRQLLQSGFSRRQLAEFFNKDSDTVTKRLKDLKPCGMRASHPIYDFKEACARLVDPVVDIEAWIKQLRPNDLPVYLQDQFWKAQLSRQKFDENRGELWRTERIVTVLADVFKTVRQRILMTCDMVEREATLNDTQRKIVLTIMDGLLKEIQTSLVDQFKDYNTDDKDSAIDDIPMDKTIGEDDDDFAS